MALGAAALELKSVCSSYIWVCVLSGVRRLYSSCEQLHLPTSPPIHVCLYMCVSCANMSQTAQFRVETEKEKTRNYKCDDTCEIHVKSTQ